MDVIEVQGTSVPALGLGTWQLTGPTCTETVQKALELLDKAAQGEEPLGICPDTHKPVLPSRRYSMSGL